MSFNIGPLGPASSARSRNTRIIRGDYSGEGHRPHCDDDDDDIALVERRRSSERSPTRPSAPSGTRMPSGYPVNARNDRYHHNQSLNEQTDLDPRTPEAEQQRFWDQTSRITRRPGDAESTRHTMESDYKDWLDEQADAIRTVYTGWIVKVQDAQQALEQARTRTKKLGDDNRSALSILQARTERGHNDRSDLESRLNTLSVLSESYTVAVEKERAAQQNLDHLREDQAFLAESGWRMVKEAADAKTFGPSFDTALNSWSKFAITCDCGQNPHDQRCLTANPTYWDKYMQKHSRDSRRQEEESARLSYQREFEPDLQ
ncbi:hypothetical protein L202_03239 [Cryptococcus amylolentus CBS 6039]|uniref:Uncharacterized protein n=2 Tax=Cryptococcus amylolentus TaxID=104669 RepID=A0A1E3HY15_9TREE|nr:hypothetical protein L202_03239 [Cryptococcus amylolentus CBS 6039]ODN81147.1 hypothetical protein L202_03239 [Cryptococcus amylolentus CBS 6039]ODO09597.1 hypothetical protein I350_03205 [Cryptococcus amylolentus CBS 6273]